ncbi:melanopsin-A-like [Hydra vulgaris]|uniref:Opsin n=1 Tax=Hydra vulgaris TaxID=6087 RepID=F1LIN9_HYDVU|nr:melanopsin-A-like [Hydra vulgaris]BAD67142.1 opsin [Hydra vulgaris]
MASVIILLSFLCGFSVVLNATVVLAIFLKRKSKGMRDIILMSLAICDGVQCTLGFPVELYGFSNLNSPLQNEYLCKANGFIVMYLALTAISHLVCLCVYRFLSIVYPLKIQKFFLDSRRKALLFILFCWIYGFFWSVTPLLGWNEIIREKEDTHRCSINLNPEDNNKRSYLYSLMVFCYFIPLVIIIFCSLRVHFELSKMLKLCKHISGREASITKETYKLERQDFISISLIVSSFFIVWTPYTICVIFSSLRSSLPTGLLTYSALFAKSSTILNPVIYCLMYKEYRETLQSEYRKIFKSSVVAPFTERSQTAALSTLSSHGDASFT